MRVMTLGTRTTGKKQYPHLKPVENCPGILLVAPWGTGSPSKLYAQQAHPKYEGGEPTWDSTLPKPNCNGCSGSGWLNAGPSISASHCCPCYPIVLGYCGNY